MKPLHFINKCFKYLMEIYLITLFLTGCEGKFLDEPSIKGINTHSFKVNGVKWVASINYGSNTFWGINYNRFNENCLTGFFQANIIGENNFPNGNLEWVISEPENITDLPKEYPIKGFVDYSSLFLDIDPSFCYVNFTFTPNLGPEFYEFTNAIYGSIVVSRYDSICSGTISIELSNETDTVYITEGVFDYLVRIHN
jgi:hypothetical protein